MRFLVRFLRLFTLRRCAFAAAALGTLIAACYVVENWRGERAWAATKKRLRAAGEPVTMAELIPVRPPDDENFMMNPVFVRRCHWDADPPVQAERWGLFDVNDHRRPSLFLAHWMQDPRAALVEWQTYLRASGRFGLGGSLGNAAEDILQALARWEPELQELVGAAKDRPRSYTPLKWEKGLELSSPHIFLFVETVEILSVKSLALLELGRAPEALENMAVSQRLVDACLTPITSSFYWSVATSMEKQWLLILWRGLALHAWSAADLMAFSDVVAKRDYGAFLAEGLKTDTVAQADFVEGAVTGATGIRPLLPVGKSRVVFGLIPRGWWRQNQAEGFRKRDEMLRYILLPQSSPENSPASRRMREKQLVASNFYNMAATQVAGVYERATTKCGEIMAHQVLVRTAIALERHRLQHGAYPKALGELASFFPDGQPVDPFTGKLPGYSLTDGIPKLWSVGADQRDDGGDYGRKPSGRLDPTKGDVVWSYPAEGQR